MIFNPLEQFEIILINSWTFFKIEFFFRLFQWTNLTETLILSFMLCFFILYITSQFLMLNPVTQLQIVWEKFIIFLENIVLSNTNKVMQKYIPIFLHLTILLFLWNLTGMLPYNFTITSHIFITFGMSFIFFVGINITGIEKHRITFLGLFLPNGVPFLLKPFLIILEIISYFSRVFSLAIRLFANMMAGHTLLKILSTFLFNSFSLGSIALLLDLLPLIILSIIIVMELGIACLQVYVFLVLSCLYLKDIFNIQH